MKDHLREMVRSAIGGEYDVGSELGRGGMSVVYGASDVRLKRQVAIKVLPPEFAYDPGIRERFQREAETSARLNHPNIVPIFTVGEKNGIVFFVMALCDGESLAAKLSRTGRSPIADARRILIEVADALAYAHSKGVVHRDIKPDNILIERDTGRSLVTDFGIARAAEAGARLTVTGVAMGTPTYMSPEQAMGDAELDGRSDIYSLGAVAYQMLAGMPPFSAPNTPALLLKHVSEDFVPLSQHRADIPPGFAAVVERALAKKKEQRWQNATALRDALNASENASAHAGKRREARSAPAVTTPATAPRREQSRAEESVKHAPVAVSAGRKEKTDASARSASRDSDPWYNAWRQEKLAQVNTRIRNLKRSLPLVVASGMFSFFLTMIGLEDRLFFRSDEFFFVWLLSMTPVTAASLYMRAQANWLKKNGIGFWRALRAKKAVAYQTRSRYDLSSVDSDVPETVLRGPYGPAVVKALRNKREIEEAVASLTKEDRSMLPDVIPTVTALAEQVLTLAPLLQDVGGDLDREDLVELEERISKLEQRGDRDTGAERTLSLLTRQRDTLSDLMQRRDSLESRLESASLLLQNIRLDMRKIASTGVDSSVGNVSSATEEARALSKEIGHVLSAADDVRRL